MKKFSRHPSLILLTCIVLLCATFGFHYMSSERSDRETVLMTASWTYNYGDLEDLTHGSDLIARISVDSADSYITDDGIPMTNYTVSINTPIYGCEEGSTVNLIMTGGSSDGVVYEIADDPLMEIEDDFIVFARKNESGTYTILSGPQGRMTIDNGLVSSLNVSDSQVRAYNSGSNISISSVPLNDFISEVQSYID